MVGSLPPIGLNWCILQILTVSQNYPLVNSQKAIEAMAIEIVDFPIKNGDFL